jgi:hypothetical protein
MVSHHFVMQSGDLPPEVDQVITCPIPWPRTPPISHLLAAGTLRSTANLGGKVLHPSCKFSSQVMQATVS